MPQQREASRLFFPEEAKGILMRNHAAGLWARAACAYSGCARRGEGKLHAGKLLLTSMIRNMRCLDQSFPHISDGGGGRTAQKVTALVRSDGVNPQNWEEKKNALTFHGAIIIIDLPGTCVSSPTSLPLFLSTKLNLGLCYG